MSKPMTQKEWLLKQGIHYTHDGMGRVTRAWFERPEKPKEAEDIKSRLN